ncbi:hypothetical protein UFOVP598_31 [uncultured Caudovirales phage]|uniref:Uncharacterized protein n=1 Tax=uncultured Caudovirales phage TaxID=2100421 RepID=A0A6J5MYZ9_9CAUD|nr:hypothetical protein UFOVP598_31 [uncultured Caudovirales phage]
MKIKTTVPVTYNNGITGQESGIVTGILSSCNQQLRYGFDSNYMFEYKTESGHTLKNDMYPVTAEETNALYNLVKNEVPTNLSYTEATEYLYYLGFRVQMAQLFGISESNIEIIID